MFLHMLAYSSAYKTFELHTQNIYFLFISNMCKRRIVLRKEHAQQTKITQADSRMNFLSQLNSLDFTFYNSLKLSSESTLRFLPTPLISYKILRQRDVIKF